MTNYFLGNQLLCFKIKSYNIFFIGMVTRLQQIFVHICANVAHKRRYSDTQISKNSLYFFALRFNVQSLPLLSSFSAVAFEFDICARRPMLSSLCFVCDLFCARSPVKGALCNRHRQAAVMREPLALLASTLPISQLCSDSAKQGCNYVCLFSES